MPMVLHFVHRVVLLVCGVLANPDNVPGIQEDSKDDQNVTHHVESNTPEPETNSDSDTDQYPSSRRVTADDLESKLYRLTCESDSSMCKSPIVRQSSTGEFGSPGPPVVTNVRPCISDSSAPSTLSTDDLTMDAAMVRPPQRSGPGQIKKTIDNAGVEDTADKTEKLGDEADKIEKLGDEIQNLKKVKKVHTDTTSRVEKANDEEMEEFIKHLIAKGNRSKCDEGIKLFDAAVIYNKTDYAEVSYFIAEVKTMVQRDLQQEVRIELYDSEAFSQSQIVVVEDLINKCSIVLAYLTTNCTTETFNLLCEEGIGLSRLALNNPDVLANRMRNDKEFVMKPVHTARPTERYYHTPVGLVTVNGIDWYDRHSAHTRSKIISTMKTAIITRKRREEEANIKESYRKAISENLNVLPKKSASGSKPSFHGDTRHIPIDNTVTEDAMSMRMSHSSMGPLPSQIMAAPGIPPQGYNPIQRPDVMQAQSYSQYGVVPLPANHQTYMSPIYQGQTQYCGNMMSSLPANQAMPYPLVPGGVYSGVNSSNAQFQSMVNVPNAQYPSMVNVPPNAQVPGLSMPQQYYGNVQLPQNPSTGHPAAMMDGQQYTSYRSQGSLPYQQGQHNTGPSQYGQHPQHSNTGLTQQQMHQQFENRLQQQQQHQRPHQSLEQQSRLQEPHQLQLGPSRLNSARYSSGAASDSLYANDAPPSAELRVVSKVTGKLIVHPNLSTDDVEVDGGCDSAGDNADQQFYLPDSVLKSESKVDLKPRTWDNDESGASDIDDESDTEDDDDSDDESGTDDDDDAIFHTHFKNEFGKGTNKHVNIVGCKYVQLGRNNRTQEERKVLSEQLVLHNRRPEIQPDRCYTATCGPTKYDDVQPVTDPSLAPTKTCDTQHVDNRTNRDRHTLNGSDTSRIVLNPNSRHQCLNSRQEALPSHVHERKEC